MATSTAAAAIADPVPDTAAGVLTAARERRRVADAAEADLLGLAVQWAVIHPADSIDHDPAVYYVGGRETEVLLAGQGAPEVAEFCVPEFASAVGLSPEAGKHLLGQALELAYRLPKLYALVQAGRVQAWKARRVADKTICLSPEAADYVDRHVAAVAGRLGPVQLDRLVETAVATFMPEAAAQTAAAAAEGRHVTIEDQLVSFTGTMQVHAELDLADALDLNAALTAGAHQQADLGSNEPLDVRRAQALGDLARGQVTLDLPGHDQPAGQQVPAPTVPPTVPPRQVVLYTHISEAAVHGTTDPVARLEQSQGLVTADQVRAWCGAPETTKITVKPVIDLDTCVSTTGPEVTEAIAEHVGLRDQTCVFPWCTRPARGCDRDHTIAKHQPGGITCSCNIAPLCRRHHRLKTHSPWTYTTLDPGTYLWTSPHGYQFLRDPTGTTDVSRDLTPDRPPPALPDT